MVVVGTGLPMIAAMHAQLTHAPHLSMIFEVGTVAPGLKSEDIQDKIDFELIIPEKIKKMEEPTDEDLRLLREVIDPQGYFIEREIR